MTSVKKFYILVIRSQNSKLLPAEKLGNILVFDMESKRELVSLILADSFIKNN